MSEETKKEALRTAAEDSALAGAGVFVTPESEELLEAGAGSAEIDEGPDSIEFEAEELEDFATLWKALESLSTDEVMEKVAEAFSDAPDRRREVLTTQMAQELGYSRVWRRRSALTREPLWEVLSASGYGRLSDSGEEAVAMIGRSVQPGRSYLHPSAALATLAVWRHTQNEGLFAEAASRLEDRALPAEPEWIYEIVGVFLADEADEAGGRGLEDLVELVLAHNYWEVAALLSGQYLVHRYGKWYHSAVVSNLVHATDVASQQYPRQARQWIEYLADAAMEGRLRFSWLEEPMRAAIRLNIDNPAREEKLRRYLEGRPFDADHRRLEQLYAQPLDDLRRQGSEAARSTLFQEVESTAKTNPARAARLLETVALYERGARVGLRGYRLRQSVDELGHQEAPGRLESWLIGLYVHSAALEVHAVELVRRAGERVDWEQNPFATREDYELYLVISDYERAFSELTCKFDGVTMEHADKHAAARVKFFVEKRVDPSRIQRLVHQIFSPVVWLGTGLTEIGLIRDAIDRGMERFEARVRCQDLGEEVVEDFRQTGVDIDDFAEIGALPVDRIEEVLQRRRKQKILLGAVAGGISGGLAPFSWGVLSLADIPVMLSITADVCSRFCWYFGFDPRQYPELPVEILAVALGGTQPAAIEPMLVRHNLNEQVLRNALVVGAVSQGGVTHLTGRGLSKFAQKKMGASLPKKTGELARRAVTRNLKRRAVESRPSRSLPVMGAFVGAALNTALIYDICEAAQAVLTDRFLERKYPEWARHIGGADEE